MARHRRALPHGPRGRRTRSRLEAVSRQSSRSAQGAHRARSDRRLRRAEPGHPIGRARSSPTTTCSSPRRWRSCRRRTARCNTTTPTTPREAGTSRSSTTDRSPPSSTSPANRRSACRWRKARADSPSASSSSRPTAAKTCCLQLAAQLEQAMPWSGRTPNSYVGQRDHALGSAHAQRRSPSASRGGRARAHGVGERARLRHHDRDVRAPALRARRDGRRLRRRGGGARLLRREPRARSPTSATSSSRCTTPTTR